MRRGFSLLEVLVATSLLGLALAVIITPLARSRISARHAQGRAGALHLADDLLRMAVACQGEQTVLGRRYLYEVTRAPGALIRVDVRVRWAEGELRQQAYVYGSDR